MTAAVTPSLLVREETAADRAAVAALYAGLGERAMLMRFSTRVPPELADRLAALDDTAAFGVVAVTGGRVVGEARLERDDGTWETDGTWEMGVAVADDHQGHGLGPRLLDRLAELARRRGIGVFTAAVRMDNDPMLRVLRRMGAAVVGATEGGVVFLEVATDGLMPGWPSGTARPTVLVESRSLWETPQTEALRRAGYDVRRCAGPSRSAAVPCALLVHGRCRLVEQADHVADLLPDGEPWCAALAAVHPGRLVATDLTQWRSAVERLTAGTPTRPGTVPG